MCRMAWGRYYYGQRRVEGPTHSNKFHQLVVLYCIPRVVGCKPVRARTGKCHTGQNMDPRPHGTRHYAYPRMLVVSIIVICMSACCLSLILTSSLQQQYIASHLGYQKKAYIMCEILEVDVPHHSTFPDDLIILSSALLLYGDKTSHPIMSRI